ncbi:ribosome biogenesis protein tsr1 [Dimargaris cristalligena]|nr:ribosome biogenesis protein tsr1 [Dimargaris cristalligena]
MVKKTLENFHHRATLKQKNKPFKSRHASKGTLRDRSKGKIQRQSVKGKTIKVSRKIDRQNAARAFQQRKRDALAETKRLFTGRSRSTKVVAIIPLCPDVSSLSVAQQMFAAVDAPYPGMDQATAKDSSSAPGASVTLEVERFHQTLQILQLPRHFWQILDATKVADYVIFALSAEVEVDAFGEACLTAIQAQGCSTTLATVHHLERIATKSKNDVKKSLLSFMHHFFPETNKVHALETPAETLHLVRNLTDQVPKTVYWREWRPYLIPDKVAFSPGSTAEENGTLELTGFLRGASLSANRLIHLPGHGDYQIREIRAAPHPLQRLSAANGMDTDPTTQILDTPDAEKRDTLVSENDPDLLQNEQTWPTEEELAEADERVRRLRRGEVGEGEIEMLEATVARRVPKGTSSYQAEWIMESENEYSDIGEDDDDDDGFDDASMDAASSDSEPEVEGPPEEYEDVELEQDPSFGAEVADPEEAARALEDLKARMKTRQAAQQEDLEFPDEVDTPFDLAARLRFQKYRGLQSFRTSPWDPYENLPLDYGRIFQLQNFKRAQRHVRYSTDDAPVGPGSYITLVLDQVPATVAAAWQPQLSVWPIFGLLPHEHKMSVLNFSITRQADFTEPIRSKDRVLLQYGYRRLWVNPVYSHSSKGGKGSNGVHKFDRFLQPGQNAVATIYAPIQFGPVHVLMFNPTDQPGVCLQTGLPQTAAAAIAKARAALPPAPLGEDRLPLVATGNLLDSDPTRIVAKRVVLTGDIFKVHQRSAVVRHMFFNREDILWFKPIELHTKHGRKGHIRESIGTHGYMKCIFDGPLTQMDAVCMNLYKRVFPKWTTIPCQMQPLSLTFPESWQPTVTFEDSDAMEE